MATTNLIITDAGLAAVAGLSGTDKVTLTEVGFGTGTASVSTSTTKLTAEFKRLPVQTGTIDAGTATAHMTVSDTDTGAYDVYEVGVYTSTGVLFAVCSSTTPFISKASASHVMLAIDLALTNVDPDSVSVGDTNFAFASAMEDREGIIEIATEAEAKAGTDAKRAITPKVLDAVIKSHAEVVHRSGTETITGNKTFTGNLVLSNVSPFVHVSQTDIVKGEQPASSQYMGIAFVDSTGQATANRLGVIETKYLADGSVCLSICAYKPEGGSTASVSLDLVYPVNGTPYITVPTPAFGDASTKIATTAWVKAVADKLLPLVGGVLTGALTISKGDLTLTEGIIKKGVKTDGLDICSGTSYADSPTISLYPTEYKTAPDMAGRVVLRVGANEYHLVLKPDGTLQWDGALVQLSGTIKTSANQALVKTDTKGGVQICGGTSLEDGGAILGYGKDYESNAEFKGALRLQATDGTNTYDVVLFPNGRMRLGNGARMNFQDNEDQHIFIDGNGDLLLGNTDGAFVRICGQESSINPGGIQLRVQDADGNKIYLIAKPDGTLQWNGKKVTLAGDCVPVTGGTFTGAIKAPTPSASSNDTTVPTTAWVRENAVSKIPSDDELIKMMTPNYSSGVVVTDTAATSAGYTVPSGYRFVRFHNTTSSSAADNGTFTATINGVRVFENAKAYNTTNGGTDTSGSVVILPVYTGDVIKTSSSKILVSVYTARA